MRAVVAIIIATWAVWWANGGPNRKQALSPASFPKCPACGGDTILCTALDPTGAKKVGSCRRCIECNECFDYEDC